MTWKTDESSGFLTNFRGRVTDSYATTDPRYNDGETFLVTWEVEPLEIHQDYGGEVPETVNVSYPVGNEWESDDRVVLEHPRGKEEFHASSTYGRLLNAVSGATENYGPSATRTDGEDLIVDLSALREQWGIDDDADSDIDPRDTSIWKDLEFDFVEVEFDMGINRKTKQEMKSRRAMPVAVHLNGAGETAKPEPAKAAKATKATKASKATKSTGSKPAAAAQATDKVAEARAKAAAAKAAKEEAATANDAGADNPFAALTDNGELATALLELATVAEDFDAFTNAAVEVDGVVDDDELLAAVLDENGPYATVAGG